MNTPILEVSDIQKYYGNKGNITKAVNRISLSVGKGEFVGIMGASGSGKTTLLNCISTIDTVTSGKIFVEGKDTKMGVGNDLFDNARSIRRILCPSKDAFDKYDQILDKVLEMSRNGNDLFILALGPTATVMAADLCKAGVQALDMGHMDIEYEWFRMGATRKVPITGKFSNEAVILGLADRTVVGELKDKVYQEQIIIDLSE